MDRVLALQHKIDHMMFQRPPSFIHRLAACQYRADKSRPAPKPLSREDKKDIDEMMYDDFVKVQMKQDEQLGLCRKKIYKLHIYHEQLKVENENSIAQVEYLNKTIEERKAMIQELTELQLQKFGGGQDSQSQGAQLDQYLRAAQHQYAVLSGSLNVTNKWMDKIHNELMHWPNKLRPLLKKSNRQLRELLTFEDLVKINKPNEDLDYLAARKKIKKLETELEAARKEYEQLKVKETRAINDLKEYKKKKANLELIVENIARKKKVQKAFGKLIYGVRLATHRVEQALAKLNEHEQRYAQFDAELKESKYASQPGWSGEPEYCQPDARMKRPVMRGRAASAPEYISMVISDSTLRG